MIRSIPVSIFPRCERRDLDDSILPTSPILDTRESREYGATNCFHSPFFFVSLSLSLDVHSTTTLSLAKEDILYSSTNYSPSVQRLEERIPEMVAIQPTGEKEREREKKKVIRIRTRELTATRKHETVLMTLNNSTD